MGQLVMRWYREKHPEMPPKPDWGEFFCRGFDGSPEAAVVSPTLTTAKIPSSEIGRLSAALLCERIQFPDAPYRRTCVKTELVWGESIR